MADEPSPDREAAISRRLMGATSEDASDLLARARSAWLIDPHERVGLPTVPSAVSRFVPTDTPPILPLPPIPPPIVQPPAPMTPPPPAPSSNPFGELPFPSPGERIKADDFRRLSQALRVLADAYALAGSTFAQPFGQVRFALAAQGYEIARVVSVNGTELTAPDDTSLDSRRVLQVMPVALGDRRVSVVLTETADTRRFMPDVTGLNYPAAVQRSREQLGDDALRGGPIAVPPLQGLTLTEASARVPR